MLTSTYVDAADNTTFRAHCGAAYYQVIFLETGVVASVSPYQAAEPERIDYWWTTPSGLRNNGTITPR